MLRKSLTIFLLAVMMLNLPYLDQLVKIPLLIEHYQEHHNENHGLSFVDFLTWHYRNAPDHDRRDHSLPFKSTIHGQQTGLQLSIPAPFFGMQFIKFFQSTAKNQALAISKPLAGCAFGIFQPPKA